VPRAAVAEHDRLDQRRPSQIVDVIERRSCANQFADDFHVTEVRRGDERRAVVRARDVLRTPSQLQRDLQCGEIVRHRRNGDDVVAIVLERVRIGTCIDEGAHRAALRCVGGDVERRAAVAVPRLDIGALLRELPDRRRVAARGCGEEPGVGGALRGPGRNLGAGERHRAGKHQRGAEGQWAHQANPKPDRVASRTSRIDMSRRLSIPRRRADPARVR